MRLFRKLQLGLENCYFDLSAISGCFGDQIVIWYKGSLGKALEDITWPSALALRSMHTSVNSTASAASLALWLMVERQFKTDLDPATT
jgi:hypothetical protein